MTRLLAPGESDDQIPSRPTNLMIRIASLMIRLLGTPGRPAGLMIRLASLMIRLLSARPV
jgi:hypothetical protein